MKATCCSVARLSGGLPGGLPDPLAGGGARPGIEQRAPGALQQAHHILDLAVLVNISYSFQYDNWHHAEGHTKMPINVPLRFNKFNKRWLLLQTVPSSNMPK